MNIPDEAVEAAASKVLEALDRGFTAYQIAYAALEAAAPFIAAQAWDEGMQAGYLNRANETWAGISPLNNPYRSQDD